MADDIIEVSLHRVVQARSGDKGDACDISVFAQSRELYDALKAVLTADAVKAHFGAYVRGGVQRYELEKLFALKFVLHDALGGGGSASLRSDNLGKSMSANLLRMVVPLPPAAVTAASAFAGPGNSL